MNSVLASPGHRGAHRPMLGAALVLGLKLAFLATSGTVRVEGPEFQGGVVQLSAPFAVSASRRQPPRQRFRNAERKGAR